MNRCVAGLNYLPKLINGKLCIIDGVKYSLYYPANCVISDNFNPLMYSLLPDNSKWGMRVVYSTIKEKENYLVNKQVQDLREKSIPPFKVGDRVHLHSVNGQYEIRRIFGYQVEVGCYKWDMEKKTKVFPIFDIKCRVGNRRVY
jgi:hypothetical protein